MPTANFISTQGATPEFTVTGGQNYPWTHSFIMPQARVASTGTRPAEITSVQMYISGFTSGFTRNADLTMTPGFGVTGTYSASCPYNASATSKTLTGSSNARISNTASAPTGNPNITASLRETNSASLRVGNNSGGSITIGTSTNRRLWGIATYIQVPATPTLASSGVTASGETISVSWTGVTDWGDDSTRGYTIQYSQSSTFASGVTTRTVESTSTSDSLAVTTAGTWYVRVFAHNSIKANFNNSPMSAASATQSVNVVLNPQATGQQRRTTLSSNFTTAVRNSGVYVSTNGFVALGADPGTAIAIPSSGTIISPLQGDLRQTYLYTYDDGTSYYIRWKGAYYSDSNQVAEYQIKFYYNSTNVDVYFITNGLTTGPSTTAITVSGSATKTWSESTVQSSTLISTGLMTRFSAMDSVDDGRTIVYKTSTVTYNGNNATSGTAPTDNNAYNVGSTVIVLGQGTLLRTNYTFLGWALDPDATEADYVQGSTFTINVNVILYAVWQATLPIFSDQSITTFGYLGKDVSTNPDRTVTATPVQAYSIIQSGTGLNPVSWLTITKATNSDNGLLSGTPTAIGTYTFKIRANNGGTNDTDSDEISFIVYPVGKRLDGVGNTINLTIAKRFNGVTWEPLTVMKRYDGTQWININ